MHTLNNNKISIIPTTHKALSVDKKVKEVNMSNNWMDVRVVNSSHQLSQLYNNICQKHQNKNKWILMINPENESLEQLANQNGINVSNILRLDTKGTCLNLNRIEDALSKWNCSAIVLSNMNLKQEQISQLNTCAEQGGTKCIVLKNAVTLH